MKKSKGSYSVLFAAALAILTMSMGSLAQAIPDSYETLKADCMSDYVRAQLQRQPVGTIIDDLTDTSGLPDSQAKRNLENDVQQSVTVAMDTVFGACAKVRLAAIRAKQQK